MGKQQQGVPKVVVIGCGISGIMIGRELQQRFGTTNFEIYERNEGPGGTWRDNTYPGCACDVPSHWYSLSTELNPDWSSKYSPQSEILKYWEGIYKKWNLSRFTHYGCTFVDAVWDNEKYGYDVKFRKSDGSTFIVEAHVLISAIGGFSTPSDNPDDLPGLKQFDGPIFHSARWNPNVDLHGKRVAVIGNGCSAAQFVPEIAKDPTTKVLNFSRTPSWFFKRDQYEYSSLEKFAFKYIPFVGRAYRWSLAAYTDFRYIVWIREFMGLRTLAEETAIDHITKTAPAKYHDFLIPKYPLGCKRVILDPGYLQCLNQSNVELVTDGIAEVNEKGIRGKSGKQYDFDVLILGTGFVVNSTTLGLDIIGADGRTLTEQWKDEKGPQGYRGTAIHNFPNFYTILGPNVATGHASVIAGTESQVRFIMHLIEPMIKYGVKSFEVKADAEDEYNDVIHKRLDGTVWNGSCASYYKLGSKLIVPYPGTMLRFWWNTRKINWDHFRQIGGSRRLAVWRRIRQVIITLLLLALAFVLQRLDWEDVKADLAIFALRRVGDFQKLRRRVGV